MIDAEYIEQQLFQVAPLPLNSTNFPEGFELRIKRSMAIYGRDAAQTAWLKITPEQFRKIEDVLRDI